MNRFIAKIRIAAVFIVFLSISVEKVCAQYTLEVEWISPPEVNYVKNHSSHYEREKELMQVVYSLFDNGYLMAGIDSQHIAADSLLMKIWVNSGQHFSWANLGMGNADEGWLSQIGYRERFYTGRSFSYKEISQLLTRLLNHAENNGFPFAVASLQNVQLVDNVLHADLSLQKNHYIVYDSLEIVGNTGINNHFLVKYLKLGKGEPYSEKNVRQINQTINQLPYLQAVKPSEVFFTKDKAHIRVYVEDLPASYASGFIGFSPQNELSEKLLVTGEFRFQSQNIGGRGLMLDLNWRKMLLGSQELQASFLYPYLFSTPIAVETALELTKLDTVHHDIAGKLKVKYLKDFYNSYYVYYEHAQSNLSATSSIANSNQLGGYADLTANSYGLGLNLQRLDYRLNPRRGYTFTAESGVGIKNIRLNPALGEELYDGLELRSLFYEGSLKAGYFIPLGNSSTILTEISGAKIFDRELLINQMYRIGGFNSLRGYDEQSILADAYVTAKLEYRFLTEKDAYLQLFCDGGAISNPYSVNSSKTYLPLAFGAGYTFRARAGMFTINYAVGMQQGRGPDFRSGKIHFGISSLL